MQAKVRSLVAAGFITLALSFGGCGSSPSLDNGAAFHATADGGFNQIMTLSNTVGTPETVTISIPGYLFGSKQELLDYIELLPPEYPGEPNYRKAWRFMTTRSYAHIPFSGSAKLYDPLLYLNSLGYGFCDDMASVLAVIWQWQGYESQVDWLNGHVVPEVRVDGSWMMFGPDFGVYYNDDEGQVASVAELSFNPSLITNPINPVQDLSHLLRIRRSSPTFSPQPQTTASEKLQSWIARGCC